MRLAGGDLWVIGSVVSISLSTTMMLPASRMPSLTTKCASRWPILTAGPSSHPQQPAGARQPSSSGLERLELRRLSISSTESDELPTAQALLARACEGRLRAEADPCQPDRPCGLEDREWTVDSIFNRRTEGRLVQYVVKWKDFPLAFRHIRTRPDDRKHVVRLD